MEPGHAFHTCYQESFRNASSRSRGTVLVLDRRREDIQSLSRGGSKSFPGGRKSSQSSAAMGYNEKHFDKSLI
jgi:hypothetical protein